MNWRFGESGWRLMPGGSAAILLAVLLKLGFLQPYEQLAYNALFRARGETAWDDRLVLIAIDDASLQRLGRFPWSRQRYVQFLDRLAVAAPTVVAIDLLWSEPSPDDTALAQAMARSRRVVLAEGWDYLGLPLRPVPLLETVAIGTGHILTPIDSDGIARKIEPFQQNRPSLGWATVQAYSLVESSAPLPHPSQPLWLNWVGSPQRLNHYSFVDVLDGKVPPSALRNKIVIVGVTATAIDPMLTPFAQNPPASGVHVQATITHNLLRQNTLRPLGYGWYWVILLLGGPGLSWLLSQQRTLAQIAIGAGLSLTWGGMSLLLLVANYWFPVALPIGLVVATTITVILTERLRLNARLQQQLQQLWQQQRDLASLSVANSPPPPVGLQPLTQLTTLAQQLSRAQSTQAAIARSLSIGLLAADHTGQIWFCNPVAETWLSVKVGDAIAACLVPQWFSMSEWQQHLDTLQQQQPVGAKILKMADQWLELQLEPLHYAPDTQSKVRSVDGLLVLIADITPKKQVEITLDQQVQELQRLDQLKDDFLSTVSHELRTPLTNIKLSIQLLKVTTSEEKRLNYLRILENECQRETDLINNLLDLQRLEAGMPIANLQEIDLTTWLPALVEPFHKRTEACQQILILQIAPDIPTFWSDEASLAQILSELMNNACKYTPANGEIRITAQSQPAQLFLSVSNSGVEIAESEFARIFDRFYRIPATDIAKQGGTGLGLALVKKLVEHLGGTIGVSSESGKTQFTVQLPL
jgi:signal transduction histidine kinase